MRVNALLCLGDLVHKLDKPAVLDILQTIQRCTAVDQSPPTLMCTLRVSNSISKQVTIFNRMGSLPSFFIVLLQVQCFHHDNILYAEVTFLCSLILTC